MPASHVFAQIVDEQRGVVLGNQVTPVPVTLDGQTHSVMRSLEAGAASIAAGARYRLQLIGGSQVYGPVRHAFSLDLASIRLTLPTASPSGFSGAGATGSAGVLPTSRRCLSCRRFEIRVKRGRGTARLPSARVFVDGKRVQVRRQAGARHARVPHLRAEAPAARQVVTAAAATARRERGGGRPGVPGS